MVKKVSESSQMREKRELRMQRFYLTCNINDRYNLCILSSQNVGFLGTRLPWCYSIVVQKKKKTQNKTNTKTKTKTKNKKQSGHILVT